MESVATIFPVLQLLFLVGVLTGNTILAIVVIKSKKNSATNIIYGLLSIIISLWLTVFYLFPDALDLIGARLAITIAMPMSFVFFMLAHTLPSSKMLLPRWIFVLLLILTLAIMGLNLSPYAFTGVDYFSDPPLLTTGPGIAPFGVTSTVFSILAVLTIFRKYRRSAGDERSQFRYVMMGIFLMLGLIILTIFLPVVFFNVTTGVLLAPLYAFFFLALTAYAIIRHQLFNLKLLAAQSFVTIISLVYLAKIFVAPNSTEIIIDILIFIATVFFGVLLIRSVKQEVKAREEIADLAEQLSSTNGKLQESNEQLRIIDLRKSEFVSIVSHQLRTPITAIKGYTSLILEDAFGAISNELKAPIEKIFRSSSRLADMVTDYLDISKIEQGTMSYTYSTVDIGTMLKDLGDDFAQVAEKRDLKFAVHIPVDSKFLVTADDGKIRQIFSNLIDNSIKYTPAGGVEIFIEHGAGNATLLIKIKDTGIGLSQDDVHHLFGKFTRGSGGQKQNTEGSGLGLYVAKKMLEAQKGKLWVDSEGPGKGSTFCIELPAATA